MALNLGKPNFDLVEPAGVGGGVVDTDRRIVLKEFRNSLGLVCTQVIGNYVDFATRRLTGHDLRKEIDELGTGVASTGLSQHLSTLSVQRGVKRKRSMAIVFEAMPFGPAGRKGQNRVQAIQGLDSTLLVGTEYCSMYRRIEVQSNCSNGSSRRSVPVGSVPKYALRFEPCDGGARLRGSANSSQPVAPA